MLVNSLFTNTLLNSINQRQTEQIVNKVAKNNKLNLSNEQVKTFKDVLSTELKTMYSKQQLISSYYNTAGLSNSFNSISGLSSSPYLSGLGLFGSSTGSLQQNGLLGGMGLLSTTSLSNLMPAYLEGIQTNIIPASVAANAYARQIF
ncbi:hypothetical protein D3C76_386620 [compost metagenome]